MPDINKNAGLVERLGPSWAQDEEVTRAVARRNDSALREIVNDYIVTVNGTRREAATALEAQAAEIARLRAALERIAAHTNNTANAYTCAKIARAALQDGEAGNGE